MGLLAATLRRRCVQDNNLKNGYEKKGQVRNNLAGAGQRAKREALFGKRRYMQSGRRIITLNNRMI